MALFSIFMKLEKYLKKFSTNKISLVLILLALLIAAFVFLFHGLSGRSQTDKIGKDQIRIEKNGEIIIINKNGLIEYRSGDKVIYKTWDSSKIDAFFSSMERKAREYMSKPPPSDWSGCFLVTLWLDGKIVTVCVSLDDEEIQEIFEEFDSDSYTGGSKSDSISDYFNDTPGYGYTNTPTPIPYYMTPSPTQTPVPGRGVYLPEQNYPPVKAGCDDWTQDIVSRAIISNTLCTVEEE